MVEQVGHHIHQPVPAMPRHQFAIFAREGLDRFVRFGQRGDFAKHHGRQCVMRRIGRARFDNAMRHDTDFGGGLFQRQHVLAVAKGVDGGLGGPRYIQMPVDHGLAGIRTRRQAQQLHAVGGRGVVAVNRFVFDFQMHAQATRR